MCRIVALSAVPFYRDGSSSTSDGSFRLSICLVRIPDVLFVVSLFPTTHFDPSPSLNETNDYRISFTVPSHTRTVHPRSSRRSSSVGPFPCPL